MDLQCIFFRCRQRGLTLTDSITALLVLGIGVLCIATVYLERTQAAPAVLLHSKASRLAAEMAERLHAYHNDPVHFENPVGVLCKPDLANVPKQQLATNDIACWQEKVGQTLPNGSGAITHDTEHLTHAYLITVSWAAPGTGTASYLLRVEVAGMPVSLNPSPSQKTTAPPVKNTPTKP